MKYLKKFNEGIFSDTSDDELSSRLKDEEKSDTSFNFDLQFAMTKVKEEFLEDRVIEMFDNEVLEWVDEDWEDNYDSEYDWYTDHNNGEAQDAVINVILKWYFKNYNDGKSLPMDEYCEFFDAIKEEFNCLNY